jgi:hypothetical protein
MSTIFGIHRENKKIELIDDALPEEYWEKSEEFIPVAFRGRKSLYWKNEVARFLPDDFPVYALDNTAQGIYTIGDVKREIKKYYE